MQFPIVDRIEDVMESIAGRKEFQISKSKLYGLTFIKYKGIVSATFPDPSIGTTEREKHLLRLRRECRGIVFNAAGKVIIRRFHKFFNVNEKPETNFETINWKRPYVVLEKLDGSLMCPIVVDSELQFVSMIGFTKHSEGVMGYIKKMEGKIDYEGFCRKFLSERGAPEVTLMFEWCSHKFPVVINYDKESLTLIAIRDNKTGKYVKYSEMVKLAEASGIPVVKAWQEAPKDPAKLLDAVYKQSGIEGYVIRFDDGDMYKVKTQYYSIAHGVNPKVIRSNKIWNAICQDVIDDLIATKSFDVKHREVLQKFRDQVQESLFKASSKIDTLVKELLSLRISPESFISQVTSNKLKTTVKVNNFLKHSRSIEVAKIALAKQAKKDSLEKEEEEESEESNSLSLESLKEYVISLVSSFEKYRKVKKDIHEWLGVAPLSIAQDDVVRKGKHAGGEEAEEEDDEGEAEVDEVPSTPKQNQNNTTTRTQREDVETASMAPKKQQAQQQQKQAVQDTKQQTKTTTSRPSSSSSSEQKASTTTVKPAAKTAAKPKTLLEQIETESDPDVLKLLLLQLPKQDRKKVEKQVEQKLAASKKKK